MNLLQSYLELYELLKEDNSTKEERRNFALREKIEQKRAYEQLFLWLAKHREKLTDKEIASRYLHIYKTGFGIISLLAFVFGFLAASVVLHYNGSEPVNVIYFLFLSFVVPLLTMLFSLLAMMKQDFFLHISFTYILQKLFAKFSKKSIDEALLDKDVLRWIFIQKMQSSALLFALGMLASLLFSITTQDIAFAWSTTLDISAKQFHAFLAVIALPWSSFLPSGVPSLELIEQSHYFRLGGEISKEMLTHAATLGSWWQFLAMETLFYAIILRLLLYIFATVQLKKTLQKSMLQMPQAKALLEDMNQPIISTKAKELEIPLQVEETTTKSSQKEESITYSALLGYTFEADELPLIAEVLGVEAKEYVGVAGKNSIEEDAQIIAKTDGAVALVFKAWEVPTMDFIDFLEDLSAKASSVTLYPLGYAKENFQVRQKDLSIWQEKLKQQNYSNVEVRV